MCGFDHVSRNTSLSAAAVNPHPFTMHPLFHRLTQPNRQEPSSRALSGVALLYGAIFLTILLMAYTGHLPPQFGRIPNYDKVGHVVLYGVAGYLGHCLLKQRRVYLLGLRWPLWMLLFGSFTIAEEIVQTLSPNRTLDAWDMVCSLVGLGLGCWLAERKRPNITQ